MKQVFCVLFIFIAFVLAIHSNENNIRRNSSIQWWYFQNMTRHYTQWKRVGRELNSRERAMECCFKQVTAWAINLTVVQIFFTARERIILNLIKMDIKIICQNLEGNCFSMCCTFFIHSSNYRYTTFHSILLIWSLSFNCILRAKVWPKNSEPSMQQEKTG